MAVKKEDKKWLFVNIQTEDCYNQTEAEFIDYFDVTEYPNFVRFDYLDAKKFKIESKIVEIK